jgi:acetyl esterase/lipase
LLLKQEVAEWGLRGTFFYNDSNKRQKALILLGGSEGGNYWSTQVSYIKDLVEIGYCVFSLTYFRAIDLPKDLNRIPLEYFKTAFKWLKSQEIVLPENYAIMGKSRGGELALILASRCPQIQAVVAIVPSYVAFVGSVKSLIWPRQVSAWSIGGQELPFVPLRFSISTLKSLIVGNRRRMFEIALQNTTRVQRAVIPIEKINGPILLISAQNDQVWPSTFMCNQIMQRLQENNFGHIYDHIMIESKHDIFEDGSSWPSILEFIRKNYPS